jgi:hypothetical protein
LDVGPTIVKLETVGGVCMVPTGKSRLVETVIVPLTWSMVFGLSPGKFPGSV